jgi:agmatinase
MIDKPDLAKLYGAHEVTTFLGIKRCSNLETLTAPIALIGAQSATPYASVGAYCRNAPTVLRQALAPFAANIHHYDFDSGGLLFPEPHLEPADCGDIPFDERDGAVNRDRIRAAVATIVRKGAVPIVIGGDDSVPIPMIEGLPSDRTYTVLQIDAHVDWRNEVDGETQGLSSTMRRASEMAHVGRIVQVGARGIGSAREADYRDARAAGVTFVTAYEVHRSGVEAALSSIPEGSEIVVCIDVDAMDPSVVPGAIGRAPGGFSYYQMVDLVRGAAARGPIAAVDVVEFMPERDIDGIGALNVARLIASVMGIVARQRG